MGRSLELKAKDGSTRPVQPENEHDQSDCPNPP